MAKKGGSNPSADRLAGISKDIYNQTNPLRQALLDRSMAFMGIRPVAPQGKKGGWAGVNAPGYEFVGSNFDPSQSPLFGASKQAIESQYKVARDNLVASSAPGGALVSNMANLEGQRANNLAATLSDITQQEYGNALNFATGGQSQAMSGLGSAAAIQSQIQSANQARSGAVKQGLGAGLGYMIGGPGGGMAGSKAGGGKSGGSPTIMDRGGGRIF